MGKGVLLFAVAVAIMWALLSGQDNQVNGYREAVRKCMQFDTQVNCEMRGTTR